MKLIKLSQGKVLNFENFNYLIVADNEIIINNDGQPSSISDVTLCTLKTEDQAKEFLNLFLELLQNKDVIDIKQEIEEFNKSKNGN